jgi:hypothetical protein
VGYLDVGDGPELILTSGADVRREAKPPITSKQPIKIKRTFIC